MKPGKPHTMKHPPVLSEDETIDAAIAGRSLARYGDGELRIAVGGSAVSQKHDPKLARELTAMLASTTKSLVCIPTTNSAKPKNWSKYQTAQYLRMFRQQQYGSAFITRPDSAPWIDRADYWDKVRGFWRDRDVVLVAGSERSLTEDRMPEAKSVRRVMGTYRDSYDVLNRIEEEVGKPADPVIICLGAAGTVLAERLARKGVWALDLGHIGMMMKNAGTGRWSTKVESQAGYVITADQLLSPAYRAVMLAEHAKGAWGRAGKSHRDKVMQFAGDLKAATVLDYGCGTGTLGIVLREAGAKFSVHDYDPGVPEKAAMPPAADLVVATDVMEHVEPGNVDNVLRHIFNLTQKAALFSISLTPSERVLNDGKNAHLTVRDHKWWEQKIKQAGFAILRTEMRKGYFVWARKP